MPSVEVTLLLVLLVCTALLASPLPPTCDSLIYCQGDLLHTVQTSRIFEDGKHFVDLKLQIDQEIVLKKFSELQIKYSSKIPKDVLNEFVNKYFIDCQKEPSCKELLPWSPTDWTNEPEFLEKIKDSNYRQWASDLNGIWKKLGRKMDIQVKEDANLTSLIYLPNGFIVPGGRFEEMYYWDTYWVVRGLLISGMTETVKGIIQNFLSLIASLGHIPNGSRVYYTQRAQPPMLISMVDAYVQKTGDKSIIKESLDLLDREMEFYISNRRVGVTKDGKAYKMYRYFAPSMGPRPESYREDYEHGQRKATDAERTKLYISLKSGAESGWDFSSRWFIKNKKNEGTILDIDTPNIIPADLNAFLHKNFKLLANWYGEQGQQPRSEYFRNLENDILTAIEEVLWNEQDGIWYDFDNLNGIPRKYFYESNFAPLWTKSHNFNSIKLTERILNYTRTNSLMRFTGGIPSSLTYTGEQWDYPNAWPPLQLFLLEGLYSLDQFEATDLALVLSDQWIRSNFHGYCKYQKMFEKYDALYLGEPGSGGEYQDQDGFGWTNGLVLTLLERYGDILISNEKCPTKKEQGMIYQTSPEVVSSL